MSPPCATCAALNVPCICKDFEDEPLTEKPIVCTCEIEGPRDCDVHAEDARLERLKESIRTDAKGIKADGEKLKFELFSSLWMSGVAAVLTFGARKYAAHNWRKGIERSRLLGACLRHVFAYLNGEDYDKETGLLHLDHASCCLMFASELHRTRPDTDDRFTITFVDEEVKNES